MGIEQIRENIARFEFGHIAESHFPGMHGFPFERLPDDWWSKVQAYKQADQILSIVKAHYEQQDPQAELIGWFIDHGWTPPEELTMKMQEMKLHYKARILELESELGEAREQEQKRIIRVAIKSGILCAKSEAEAIKSGCSSCKLFWKALKEGGK